MRISSFFYSIRQGLKNIRRNLLFSLASIGTIVSCLFLFGIFYCIIVNFRTAMKNMENTVTISVFFDEGISEDNIRMIGEQIRLRDEVNTMDYISPEQAWEEYAKSFNITTEDKGLSVDNIIDLTVFMNWYNEEYQEVRDKIYKPEPQPRPEYISGIPHS